MADKWSVDHVCGLWTHTCGRQDERKVENKGDSWWPMGGGSETVREVSTCQS